MSNCNVKPKIYKGNDLWHCHGGGVHSIGSEPVTSYQNWLSSYSRQLLPTMARTMAMVKSFEVSK